MLAFCSMLLSVCLFLQRSLSSTCKSDESKDVGCIIVDRCIDFLDIYGLCADGS